LKDALDPVRFFDEASERHVTPCGVGGMVWRVWGEGATLVLLHGGHGSWTHWIRVIGELARRYRVVAPDLPGLGESAKPPEPYSAESLAAIVAQGLDIVTGGEPPFQIVGFSFGGLIGGHVARLLPARVRKLVLVGAGGLGLPRGPREEMWRWHGIEDPQRRLAAHRRNLEILMIHDPAKVDDLAVRLQAENATRARLKSRPIAYTDTLRRALASTEVPLAGIWGERDATVGSDLAEFEALLRRLRPNLEFRSVAGAGHWAAYEAPDLFLEALHSVLEQRSTAETRGSSAAG